MISTPHSKTFALIDCNNFYVSCERVFNHRLNHRPVVVLSNNDGCIVARSNEVKDLGVPMGAPYFQFKELLESVNCAVFSSNYALYGDMSSRVMSCLYQFSGEVEIYSIDEAFIRLDHISRARDLTDFGYEIKDYIYKATGIPVSVGIASTKTLCKAANQIAKKEGRIDTKPRRGSKHSGVLSLIGFNQEQIDYYLNKLEAGDLWGVGRRYAKMLESYHISTALSFSQLSERFVKEKMTIQGLRTLKELKGISCIPLCTVQEDKKGMLASRSFGQELERLEDIKPAVATFCTRLGEKMRQQKSKATFISVFLTTSYYKDTNRRYQGYLSVPLPQQTNLTTELIKTAFLLLEKIYKPGYKYKKAGVMVSSLTKNVQESLFELSTDSYELNSKSINPKTSGTPKTLETSPVSEEKQQVAHEVVDKLNQRFGRYSVKSAALSTKVKWQAVCNLKSGRFTTEIREIMKV